MTDDIAKTPNRLPWPPMILGAAIAGSLALEWIVPTNPGLPGILGAILIGGALALDAWSMWTMARARTNTLPHRAADRLVTSGPFAFSRNPIYVGNAALVIGTGFAIDSLWPLLAAPVAILAMHRLAILREERHLAARFGSAWSTYAARTPRWIGLPGRP